MTGPIRGLRRVRDQVAGLIGRGIEIAIAALAVGLPGIAAPRAGSPVEPGLLVAANAVATMTRFGLLGTWRAGDRRPATGAAPESLALAQCSA